MSEQKTYSYEEVHESCLEYFHGDELAADVFVSKYCMRDKSGNYLDKTPDDMHKRLASEFARIDAKFGDDYQERYDVYYNSMKHFGRIVPQGSPMSAIGNEHQVMSASNCVVVASPEDNIHSIFERATELAQLFKRRCGTGIDISTLRPDGQPVNNAARTTTGAWSFADLYSFTTNKIGQSGRRGALMITISVHHPDVVKFATMKHDSTKVTGANISVRLTDEFLQAVVNDEDYEVRWPVDDPNPKIRKMVPARRVWDVIVSSAHKSAEPGLLLWDTMCRNLPADCYPDFKSVSTNPCCFDKEQDVHVITKQGVKEIKDVTSKDLIWVDSEKCWSETSGYFNAGNAEVFKVSFSNNEELFITSNHKLEKVTSIGREKQKELVRLRDLHVGDRIALHQNEVKDLDLSSDLGAYDEGIVLGWLSGDGCLTYRSNDVDFPAMHLAFWEHEYDVAEKILGLVKKAGYNNKLVQHTDVRGNVVKRIISSKIVKDLASKYSFDISSFKSGNNRFLYSCSKDFVKGYLSSYFSADGTVTESAKDSRHSIQLSSIDKSRLEQVKNLLLYFGITSHIGLLRVGGVSDFGVGGVYDSQDCFRLTICGYNNISRFNENIGMLSDRKQRRIDGILKTYVRAHKNKVQSAKIVSIERVGVKPVGCIEVNKHHKFTANGFVSGNSEIILSAYDSCRLISINLTGYVRNPFQDDAYFDFDSFIEDVKVGMQMSDNLVELELELIRKIQGVVAEGSGTDSAEYKMWEKFWLAGNNGRRTGLGTHGLADTLAQLCIKYDSSQGVEMVSKIYEQLRNHAYGKSVDLAKKRGFFPAFNWELEKDNEFIKRLPSEIIEGIKKHGRRNISLLTQAPTGSISIISKLGNFNYHNISSGIEPVFKNFYTRRKKINASDENSRVDFIDNNGEKWQEFKVFHNNVRAYVEKFGQEELPSYFVESAKVSWEKRLDIQAAEQIMLDHSISSTINLSSDVAPDIVGGIYINAWKKGLKGVTVYVDGSRDGVLVTGDTHTLKARNYIVGHYNRVFTEKKAFDLYRKMYDALYGENGSLADEIRRAVESEEGLQGDFDFESADSIEIPKLSYEDLLSRLAPVFDEFEIYGQRKAAKRPFVLDSRTHKIRADFGDGKARNAYVTVSFMDGMPYEILIQHPHEGLEDKDIQILELTARNASMLLRHKVPLVFICEQMEKVGGQYVHSLPTNIARVLRSYIDQPILDNPVETEEYQKNSFDGIILEKCPKCGERAYRRTGQACGTCETCGFSSCG